MKLPFMRLGIKRSKHEYAQQNQVAQYRLDITQSVPSRGSDAYKRGVRRVAVVTVIFRHRKVVATVERGGSAKPHKS